jgi:peptide deformylase
VDGLMATAPASLPGARAVAVSGTAMTLLGLARGATDLEEVLAAGDGEVELASLDADRARLAALPAPARVRGTVLPPGRAAPGVGLAAPQIGRDLQLVVIEDAPARQTALTPAELARREREVVPFHVLVNPRLTIRTDELVHAYEGCLSFAGFSMVVPRARTVRVEAWDEHGQPVVKVATGWYARILQHEVDHLRGTVCIDRAETRTLTTGDNFVAHWSERGVAAARAAIGPGPDLTDGETVST